MTEIHWDERCQKRVETCDYTARIDGFLTSIRQNSGNPRWEVTTSGKLGQVKIIGYQDNFGSVTDAKEGAVLMVKELQAIGVKGR